VDSSFFDENEKPVANGDGVWSVRKTHDPRGNVLTERYFGVDGGPCTASSGWAGVDYRYDERDLVVERVTVALDSKPSKGFLMARNVFDDRGNTVEFSVVDWEGKPATNTDGISKERHRRDERGRIVESSWFDPQGQPASHKAMGGVAVRYKYDDKGVKREESVLDARGAVSKTRTYDARGKLQP
jgi:YD repeat-containing protein